MPLASMSNVTSICGTPRGAGGIPSGGSGPSVRLSRAIGRSPCSTWISTEGWLSAAVVNVSAFLVGMVVLRSISLVITPPSVSMPSDSGVTSSRSRSFTSPGEHRRLHRRAHRHHLVRVHRPVRLLAEQLLDLLLHLGHAGRAAHQDDLVDVAWRSRPRPCAWPHGRASASARPGRPTIDSNLARVSVSTEVLGPGGVRGDERQVDLGLHRGRELDLGLLRRLLQALEGHLSFAQIDAVVLA